MASDFSEEENYLSINTSVLQSKSNDNKTLTKSSAFNYPDYATSNHTLKRNKKRKLDEMLRTND
jgi:hypothetical protein